MEKDRTLLILAAGMGSRFGGLKQIEPIDENGNFIIDYSIYDAVRNDFNKVVFVIKEENLDVFQKTVGDRVSKHIDVDYAFQKMDSFVSKVPQERTKPWGTAHAILCAKDKVQGDFAIINADDFYGNDAFAKASEFFDQNNNPNNYGLVAYQAGNTLTENGSVKRGVCQVQDGLLTNIIESKVEKTQEGIIASPLSGDPSFLIPEDQPVSMNLMCFNSKIFDYIEKDFSNFLEKNKDDLSKCECLIPDVLFHQMEEEGTQVNVVPTDAKWHGVTYKEDKPEVVGAISDLVKMGEYPNNLWKPQQEAIPCEIVQ